MALMSLSAAILAGGKAERMSHQDKGLMHYQGTPMALLVGQALRHVADHVFVNANRNYEQYSELGFDVVADEEAYLGMGPLSGLMACLNTANSSHLLISPCDTPCITHEAFTLLQQVCISAPESIYYLSDSLGIHPLHAILPVASARASLSVFLSTGNRHSVMAFYDYFGCESVEWKYSDQLLNVNTPQQLLR
ncbi:molybdenum cofactor guanylyltransferase [Marinomonas pontica]|uniref:Molybdenum cofactor guanylyltransferase n=2 Tax=Marinomonas pontica TaxID=264739 RepID=A0ABM8FEA6_9GAMM|nr:molybdenum cofactor guanylyltransferase [Marinomonas pontica]